MRRYGEAMRGEHDAGAVWDNGEGELAGGERSLSCGTGAGPKPMFAGA